MKKIFLRGKKANGAFALVDDEDFEYLNQFKWRISTDNYAQRSIAVPKNGKNMKSTEMMHKDVLKVPKGMVVDHINKNKLDNRRSNLRAVTYAQNILGNMKKGKYGRGVHYDKRDGGWYARLTYNGKRYEKRCPSRQEAADLYDKMAKEYWGEFAVLNS